VWGHGIITEGTHLRPGALGARAEGGVGVHHRARASRSGHARGAWGACGDRPPRDDERRAPAAPALGPQRVPARRLGLLCGVWGDEGGCCEDIGVAWALEVETRQAGLIYSSTGYTFGALGGGHKEPGHTATRTRALPLGVVFSVVIV
jgi:hypothetical protein